MTKSKRVWTFWVLEISDRMQIACGRGGLVILWGDEAGGGLARRPCGPRPPALTLTQLAGEKINSREAMTSKARPSSMAMC